MVVLAGRDVESFEGGLADVLALGSAIAMAGRLRGDMDSYRRGQIKALLHMIQQ